MPVSGFTQPGEVLFNLVALIQLTALLFFSAFFVNDPRIGLEWWFWPVIAGSLTFWSAFIAVLVRLRRAGDRPRWDFRHGLSVTGSRASYNAYVNRFGRDTLLWAVPAAAIWSLLTFLTAVVIVGVD